MRGLLVALLVTASPALAQTRSPGDIAIERGLASGDGRSRATAIEVEGLLREYTVLGRLGLRFVRQRSDGAGDAAMDVVTAKDIASGETRDVWFRPLPDPQDDPEVEHVMRATLSSGDGNSPQTAFVIGERIGTEAAILRIMGMRMERSVNTEIGSCPFKVAFARDPATGAQRQVFFKLGRDSVDAEGACELRSDPPAGAGK